MPSTATALLRLRQLSRRRLAGPERSVRHLQSHVRTRHDDLRPHSCPASLVAVNSQENPGAAVYPLPVLQCHGQPGRRAAQRSEVQAGAVLLPPRVSRLAAAVNAQAVQFADTAHSSTRASKTIRLEPMNRGLERVTAEGALTAWRREPLRQPLLPAPGCPPPSHLRRRLSDCTRHRSVLGPVSSTPGRIRTCDIRLRRPALYPAELRGQGDRRYPVSAA